MAHQNLHHRLKEFFAIPRQIISNNIDLEHCTHCGRFDVVDTICTSCEKQSDCFWLFKNDQFSSNNSKPLWQQRIALDFAVDFISVKIEQWEHNEDNCKCHICEWLRSAKDVSHELDKTIKIISI